MVEEVRSQGSDLSTGQHFNICSKTPFNIFKGTTGTISSCVCVF